MEIYFVRHGETGGNVAHRHQADNTQLTTDGEKQAAEVAEIVKDLNPTHLVSSKLVRAIETAQIIGEACHLVPETSKYFIELARPDGLYGHRHASLRSFVFYVQWYLGLGAGKREGEPYRDLRERIQQAKIELQKYPDNARVVVVSHTVFINFFVAHVCREQMLGPIGAAKTFIKLLTMQNAQVIKINLDNSSTKKCPWSVES